MTINRAIPTVLITLASTVALCAGANKPTLGVFEPAACPVALPEGVVLGSNVEFGYVTVPERHANPTGPTIALAVARFRSLAEDPEPDPLILNTGGPGDSNMDQFLPVMASEIGKILLARRDVVIIELRGLRYSKPALVCDEVFDAQLSMVDKNLSGQESNQILVEAMRACHDRFVAQGIDLSGYNNVETAADIAMVMTTLGYDRFNLFGSSAGTMVAQHVMRGYPERVRSVVLNAAVPLGMSLFGQMMDNAAASLEHLFTLCSQDRACAAAYPDLETRFFALIDELNQHPVTLPVTSPVNGETTDLVLNGDRLSTWLFTTMYHNTQIPQTVAGFLDGDFTMLQQSPHIFFPLKSFTYGLSYSSVYAEEEYDLDQVIGKAGKYTKFTKGTSMFFDPKNLAKAQQFWKVDNLTEASVEPLHSDVPTLLLNGELDHVIPASSVAAMAKNLSNGHLFLFPGIAHSPIDAGDCAFSMTLQFLADPTKAPDSTCMQPFKLEFRTPTTS